MAMAYYQLVLSFSQKTWKLIFDQRLGSPLQRAIRLTAPELIAMTLGYEFCIIFVYTHAFVICLYCGHKFSELIFIDEALIKVIKLSKPVVFNHGIQPICLPSLAPSLVNATVSGIMLREWTVNKLKNEGEKWIYRYFKHFSYIQLINSTVCRSCNVHRWLGCCQVFVCF